MKFQGISIKNYRSIGEQQVLLSPWRKCNLLIGQNNSGKSNVINAISKFIRRMDFDEPFSDELERHRRDNQRPMIVTLSFLGNEKEDKKLITHSESKIFDFELTWGDQGGNVLSHSNNTFANITVPNNANNVLYQLTKARWNGHPNVDSIKKEFTSVRGEAIFNSHFRPLIFKDVQLIPEFRKIEEGENYSYGGKNLVRLLRQYQHPEIGKDKDRMKFEKIEKFVKNLLHIPNAVIEIPTKSNEIIIENDGLRLPLSSYGTGVHELIIMITAVLSMENILCCMEEPEIHLHPRLQRELLEFLVTETDNEYLISTHSPTLINAKSYMSKTVQEKIQVFHIFKEQGNTVGGPVLSQPDALMTLNDLGVNASDILQSNCVIWVEGPSDRIYINHWINLIAPELEEGHHYSIMFYGGRLISHLSVEREKVPDELIEILKLNQHAIVVIDSDKKKSRDRLSSTKSRIREECNQSDSYCWITHGREIENYLPNNVVETAYRNLKNEDFIFIGDRFEKFEDSLSKATKKSKPLNYQSNKVKYSKAFVKDFKANDLSKELKKDIKAIVRKIKSWNN